MNLENMNQGLKDRPIQKASGIVNALSNEVNFNKDRILNDMKFI